MVLWAQNIYISIIHDMIKMYKKYENHIKWNIAHVRAFDPFTLRAMYLIGEMAIFIHFLLIKHSNACNQFFLAKWKKL